MAPQAVLAPAPEGGFERPLIPRLHEAAAPSERDVRICEHELLHCAGADYFGIPLAGGSIGDDGNSLARVTLAVIPTPVVLQVIGAMGSLDTPSGGAMGYGSDLMKVKLLQLFHNGVSIEQAQSIGESIKRMHDGRVLRKAAEIFAVERSFTGTGGYHSLMSRARALLEIEDKETKQPSIYDIFNQEELSRNELIRDYDSKVIISEKKNNEMGVRYIGGVIERDETMCRFCQGIDGIHAPTCQTLQKSDNIIDARNRFGHQPRANKHGAPLKKVVDEKDGEAEPDSEPVEVIPLFRGDQSTIEYPQEGLSQAA